MTILKLKIYCGTHPDSFIEVEDYGASCTVLQGCTVQLPKKKGETKKTFDIKAGFRSDWCSIPSFLSCFGFSKRNVKWDCAGIIHDYLYGNGRKLEISRKTADKLFKNECRSHGTTKIKAFLMYISLRLFAKKAYK